MKARKTEGEEGKKGGRKEERRRARKAGRGEGTRREGEEGGLGVLSSNFGHTTHSDVKTYPAAAAAASVECKAKFLSTKY